MRAHILGTGLLLGLAVTAFAAPVALADDTTGNETEPFLAAPGELLAPGQELQIQGYCTDPAADLLTPDALTNVQILHDPESGPPNLNASGVVAEGTSPGVYPVTMDCAGQTLSITFTVVDAEGQPPPAPPDVVLHFNPTAARPGDTVSFTVACEAGGAAVTSPALGTVTLRSDPEGHQPWAVHGTTTVNQDAAPGNYPVSLQCGPVSIDDMFTVLDGQRDDDSKTGDRAGQVSRVPHGAPETGNATQDASVPLLAVGLVLGAATGAGAIAWRAVGR
jgi:hypothetical protein